MRKSTMKRWYKHSPTKNEVEISKLIMTSNQDFSPLEVFPCGGGSLYNEREISQFVWVCGAEARGESILELQLVAQVVMNRFFAHRTYFGLNVRDIIFKCNCSGIFQFSCASAIDINHHWHEREDKSVWIKVAKTVLPYYLGSKVSSEPKMLYYHDRSIKKPSWVDGLQVIYDLPKIIFYKENK